MITTTAAKNTMFFDNEDNYDDCGKQGKDEYKSDICVFVGGGGEEG